MDFQILSDCHLEFYKDSGAGFIDKYPANAESLIIAGDFITLQGNEKHFFDHMKTLCKKFKNVVYITGNHEYYHNDIKTTKKVIRDTQKSICNFHFLDKETVTIGGKVITGCTLWFKKSPVAISYKHYLNDYRMISSFESFVYDDCAQSLEFLKNNINSDIIITHHLPSYESVPERFKGDKTNCYFVCDVENLIKQFKGKWVQGHTHTPVRYNMGDAEIIANPLGYPGENNFPFDNNVGF